MTDTVIAIREVTFYAAFTILSVTRMQTYVNAFITQMHAVRFNMINELFYNKNRCTFWVSGRLSSYVSASRARNQGLKSRHYVQLTTEARSERGFIGGRSNKRHITYIMVNVFAPKCCN